MSMRFVAGAVKAIEDLTEEFVDAVQEAAENVGNFFVSAFKGAMKMQMCPMCSAHVDQNMRLKTWPYRSSQVFEKHKPNGPHWITRRLT